MEIDEDENLDAEDDNATAYAKAEAVFRRGGSLKDLSVRTGHLAGVQRLSVGGDCEDGMAGFRLLESAKRRREEEG